MRNLTLERRGDRLELFHDLRRHLIAEYARDRQADEDRDDRVLRREHGQQYRAQAAPPPGFRRRGCGKDGRVFAFNRAHMI